MDGGWLHLGDQLDALDAAWEVLAPPHLDGVASMPAHRPRKLYGKATCPVVLLAAVAGAITTLPVR